MTIKIIEPALTVCQVADLSGLDLHREFCFVQRTDEELSVVCPTDAVPARTLAREDGWRAFRIEGVLDFSLIGILAAISAVLAEAKIGIFAISTYNTDYILVKADALDRAIDALRAAGYTVV